MAGVTARHGATPPQNTQAAAGPKSASLSFRSKMASEAPSQRPSFFNYYFSCFRTRFGHENCKFSTPRNPQNQAFSFRRSSFLRFRRFPFECPLFRFLAASWAQFWCLSRPLREALGPSWGLLGVFLAVSWGLLVLLGGILGPGSS